MGIIPSRRSGKPKATAFTLIELLVVVSIIAILAAMLLPVLGRARQVAVRTVCISNLRQCVVAANQYADDNDGRVPESNPINPWNYEGTCSIFYCYKSWNTYPWDFREMMRPYMGTMDILICPATDAPPIDDPRNDESAKGYLWGNIIYAGGGRKNPNFGTSDLTPARLAAGGSEWVMFQDMVMYRRDKGYWEYNHGEPTIRKLGPAHNPSNSMWRQYGTRGVGAVLSFYDGHVEWYDYAGLVDVGESGSNNSDKRIFSVRP